MTIETEINILLEKVAQLVNETIPVEWKEFYFQSEVKEGDGGVFFFFNQRSSDEFEYCYYIPDRYNVDRKVYIEYEDKLFDCIIDLQELFIKNHQEPWFSVTIIVNEQRKLNVQFDYINWSESTFGPSARLNYFQYKYLNKEARDEKEKEMFLEIEEFEQKHKR